MTKREAIEYNYRMDALGRAGISREDAESLRRISMTLHRWSELECGFENGCIERDETTNKPYWLNSYTMRRSPIADREKGALKRLAAIMAKYPTLTSYVQGDPRGAAFSRPSSAATQRWNKWTAFTLVESRCFNG